METKLIPSKNYLCYTTQTTLNKLQEFADKAVDGVYEAVAKGGLKASGPMEFIYLNCSNDRDKEFTLEIALPIENSTNFNSENHRIKKFEDFKCLSHTHNGDLLNLPGIYQRLFEEVFKNGIKPTNQIREIYKSFSGMESNDNITEIQIGIN
ncbi:MAG: GyrI-like domain-containing protein [Sporocytophaga sp.]|uniref:GyrI-like domain-containing protein n=1 Tax=Sporocytophaga sp. TaxID=2231183 RepID=UPI001AFF3243|nr:GyrI-like domain-containing protein [Sporocytophaga sp.]MBO9699506.1 GyrI-like domain-containing protein [Sporocytophaga sp.]